MDLLKLDMEAAEESVIQDLSGTGALDFIDKIIMEYHPHLTASQDSPALLKTLEAEGFGYYIARDGKAGDARPFHICCYNKNKLGAKGVHSGVVVVMGER